MRHTVPLALILAAACGAADAKVSLNAPTIDTLPGGIVRVRNTGPTGWADTNGWKLVLEHTFAIPDGSPGQLNNPSGIVADSKGNIYVLDSKPATIKAYSADGAFLRTIGRDGSGPGEFRQWGMLTIARDTLVQHDPGQSRTST
ncbi:MAG: 6-bladed beta-propeller, partial [Gemmatimonadota bacterium]